MKQIITHANPDLDAIVSAWLAQDFLFQEHESEVLFVSRKPLIEITYQGDTHRNSEALKQSRIDGPHAELTKLKTQHSDTTEVYQRMVLWLRSYTKNL